MKLMSYKQREEVTLIVKLKYGNMEEANKYWLEEKYWKRIFCGEDRNCIER